MKPPLSLGVKCGEELVAVAVNDALEGAYGQHKGKEEITRRGSELLAILSGQRRRHRGLAISPVRWR